MNRGHWLKDDVDQLKTDCVSRPEFYVLYTSFHIEYKSKLV
ncbi:hypothetical protein M153_3400015369 [Pseudoloma neurophilia]|uniref:Uncharacterized protein n=1 Tax=Pseudoloma neurophilia TaxID=146866 RepID=A0A0R0M136_9MICR|nr:hypothetical protein M153_3400015369 [Pseudoloma neurophilia]